MALRFSRRRLRTLRTKPLASGAGNVLEALESRVLLSVAHVATHDFIIEHRARAHGRHAAPAVAFTPNGLTPALVRQAYGVNQVMFGNVTGDGSGQTIAIVDAYNAPSIVSDLHTFDSLYSLPDPTLTRINQSGGTTLPHNDPAGRGNSWAVETSLDVEWAHAMAPKANILLVLANSASDADLMAAVNTARNRAGVSDVSMSWGGDELSTDPSYNSYFTTPSGHTGVTFLAASGDSGAYGSSGTRTVGYPAASPNVVAVGGTSLTIDSSGNYISESGWGSGTNSYLLGGSGGGISRYESQPVYQGGVVTQSASFRALPDVAFLADPNTGAAVIDSWDFGNTTPVPIGGTSLATPMWAGVIALANQGRALGGLGTLDGATQTLPRLYALPSSDFHDISSGNNGYAAGAGFDLVTGRGSPIVNKLVPDLAGAATPAPSPGTPGIGSFTITPSSVNSGATVTLTAANVTETGGTVANVRFYLESNSQSGLQAGSDTLIGTGVKNGITWTITASTAGLGGGSFTYYALATDTANVSSSVAQAALTVMTPTFNSFTVSPSRVSAGTPVTLSANVTETGGTVADVAFYAESNGTTGLQSSSDVFLGNGAQSGSTWTLSATTNGLATGRYTFYAVATDAQGLTTTASTVLNIAPPVSSNDNFANGTVLSGTLVSTTGSNVNATRESGEPNIIGNPGGHSVWWTWTAPASGLVYVDTHGSNFDTLLGVYKGNSVSGLTLVASNDDDPTSFTVTSLLAFNAVAGQTYHIAVDGYNGAAGNIALHLQEMVPPANDSFAKAAVLAGNIWTGNNFNATREAGEPSLAGNPGGSSVWVNWTAPASGVVTLSTAGSDFDTMLGVYTGTSVSALTKVAANDDVSYYDVTSQVTFNAVAGRTYHIRIDGYNAAQGNIVLTLS
jgi:hypothetical protein